MSSIVLAGPPVLRAATPTTVWGLDPDGARAGCGCSACSACRSHAHYKLFASSADADTGRAHPFCRCEIVSLGTLDAATYSTLFLRAGGRPSVDTRHGWVQTALAASPSPPPAPSALTNSGSGQPTAPSSKPTATPAKPGDAKTAAATARLRAAWVRRLGPDRRAVFLQLEASRPLEATIALHRHGRPIARRTLTLAAGRQTVRLPLATTVQKGPATVRVRFASVPGSAKREVSVPAKLPPST